MFNQIEINELDRVPFNEFSEWQAALTALELGFKFQIPRTANGVARDLQSIRKWVQLISTTVGINEKKFVCYFSTASKLSFDIVAIPFDSNTDALEFYKDSLDESGQEGKPAKELAIERGTKIISTIDEWISGTIEAKGYCSEAELEMIKEGYVTKSTLQKRFGKQALFKPDYKDSLNNTIGFCIECGYLDNVDPQFTLRNFNFRGECFKRTDLKL